MIFNKLISLSVVAAWTATSFAISPNDVAGSTDSDRIEAAIAAAVTSGENEVVIPENNQRTGQDIWLIDRAILLPSNLRLVLDDCLVRLSPGTQDNIIRNTGTMEIPMVANTNITIVGQGNAVLSGGTEVHFDPPGDKSGWRTIGILLYNTQNFDLKSFTMEETQAWAISMENGCAYGSVSNITFSNTTPYINQDGVDVRKGCHHITIQDIFGITGDDSVALTGLRSSLDGSVTSRMQVGDAYPAASDDIHDIIVRNVRTYMVGGNHTVRLLNHDGIKLYNISISDVYDLSVSGQVRAAAGLKIGDVNYSTLALNQLGETYNIFATNINSRATSVVLIQGTLQDAVLCDLKPFDGAVPLVVGTMPTQNVVVCSSLTGPASVQMNGAVLEADISSSACDTLTIKGDLIISGDTRVEVLTSDLSVLKECKGNIYAVCTWSGEKTGSFQRKTNLSGWFIEEDLPSQKINLVYRDAGTIIFLN
ncbi:MAG: hypothetical protein PF904_15775 [Kiritimatiellae bacterium]|jgi:hypothetical protein|nr:hypothetical protein [Kiritimatiellia bacterium]